MLVTHWNWLSWLLIGICWGAFGLVWVAGALYNSAKAPAVQQRSNTNLSWIVGVALIFGVSTLIPARVWSSVTVSALWPYIVGAVCLVLCTALTLWARGVLGTMWSDSVIARVGHRLRTTGPYRITRHPIYTGVLGMLTGTALLSGLGIWIAYWLIGVAIIVTKAVAEERLLLATFGPEYRAYQRKVPWLIPGVHWPRDR